MDALFDFTDKVVMITGGSRGLGLTMARAFAERGAHLIIASRKLDSCELAATAIRALGRRALAVACHVGRWQDIDALVESSYREFGRIDVLINNAGMSPVVSSSLETAEDLVDKVIALNFKGPFRLSAQVGSRMAAGHGGSAVLQSQEGEIVVEGRLLCKILVEV